MPQIDTLKPLATLFAALLFAVGLGGAAPVQAQDGSSPVLSVPSVEAEAGSGVDVPVEATDFNNVGAASLTITYDPGVVSFANGADTESPISGAPDGFQANVVEPGELRVNFVDLTGENPINFGTGTLFTVNFGSFEGGTSPVAFGADSQVNDPNGDALGATFEGGSVSGQVGAVTAGTVEGAGLNQTVSVPLSADGIQNVGAASFEVEFDESVLAFEGVSGDESGLGLQGTAEGGVVTVAGTDTDGATLEGEFVDLEFRFLGGSSAVTFAGGSEIVDATPTTTEIATNFSGGEVAGDSPTVSLPDASGVPGDTLTVPVETSEIQDVGSASIVVTFDGNALSFAGSEESLEGFQVESTESGVVNVGGTSIDGVDPSANGGRFADLQFTVESGLDPGETTPVGFDRAASEITNPDAERTLAYNTTFEDGQVQSTQTVPTLSVPSVEAEAGSGVDVPVEATDFNNVGAASLTITYDPGVVSFANGADTESPISGAPDGFQANVVEPGELRVNFVDLTGENPINFGTGTLFTVNFGSFEGGTSPVAFGADSQVNDPNGDALGATFEGGSVSGQVGAVTAGTVEGAGLNQTVSVPLSADGIQNVGAASFEVEFDESVLAFEGVSGDESGLGLQGTAEGGVVTVAGTDTDGATLEGEFVDLEFRFLGGSSAVTFAGGSEIVDATPTTTEIATNFSGGEVAGDSPTLSFPDRGVTAGDTISVPVQTTELQDIGSASVVVNFNPASLAFVGSEESLEGFQVGSPESGVVNVSGTSTDGVDPSANESKITSLLFEVGSGFGEGNETILGFDAATSELTNPGVERTLPYNVSFEEGRLVGEQAQIAVSPESVTYDVTAIDSTSGRVVTISNEASEAARLSGESVLPGDSAPFTIASGGGSFELGPGESRDITVEYAPAEASNPDRDTLEISHNAENTDSPIEVALEGTAEAPSIAASVEPDTAAVRSGEELALTQTVTNEATDAAVLEVEVTGVPDFLSLEGASVTGGEGAVDGQALTLQPGAEAEIEYSFQEAVDSTTTFDGVISHQTNDPDAASPLELPVEITAEAARVAVVPDSVGFGPVAIQGARGGDAAPTDTFDIENRNGATLTVDSVTVSGDSPFAVTEAPETPFDVGAGESQPVEVTYDPSASGADAASVVVSSNAEAGDGEVQLTGQAEAPSIAASVAPDTAAVRSGEELALTQTVANEAADAAVLEVEVTGVPDFLSLEGASVTGGEGAVDGQALTLQPGAEAELEYSFQESVDTTTVFGGAIAHQTNDPQAASPLELPVEITVDPVQVALNAQALDLTAGDTELRVEEVTANAGDAVVVTTDDGDGDFTDEEVVGSTTVEENVNGGEVLVDVGDADPVDHAAHVSTDGTVSGVVATSDRAPVYAVDQFDWQDETSVGPAGTVTVDVVEILYEGSVGQDTISINLHEASGGEITGEFVGISQEDLAVNVVHEEVAVDVIEPISPPAESPQRTESTIAETGEFFAMAHLGPAGTGADGGRVPVGGAQQPPLRTTASPGVIGDFATVTVEAADLNVSVSRDFEGGASDPADYELVAIPGSTGVDVAETVTGDRGTNWRAFLETGGSGGDGSLQSYGDEPFSFRAGRGVWVLAQNGWSFEGTVPAVSAADGTPSVPLQDGWNAISNPLQEDLVWADVRDASGLSEALFRWTGEGGFQPVDTLRSAQENGEAYYTLNNEGADSLELTSSAGPNSTLAANTAAESRSNASPRTVELSATADGKSMTSTVTVGMNPSAEEASSYRAPPAHFGGTALRIRDGDPVKSFMRMVAATDAETSRFDLSLQAEPGTSVEISAGDLPKNAGPGFGVVLVDGGDTYDLRDGPATVTVSENSGSAGFQVRLGDAEKIAQQTAPGETRLRANYPNPFSEQTTIEYDLAEQSEVNIRVYNVLGQQVATLAQGRKQAGTYKIDWSGQNLSSGKYFVRLEAGGTTDTKQVTVVR